MKPNNEITGYAYASNGSIDINTVSSTVRAARVNALATVVRIKVTADWTDEMILEVFEEQLKHRGQIVTVKVATDETE